MIQNYLIRKREIEGRHSKKILKELNKSSDKKFIKYIATCASVRELQRRQHSRAASSIRYQAAAINSITCSQRRLAAAATTAVVLR